MSCVILVTASQDTLAVDVALGRGLIGVGREDILVVSARFFKAPPTYPVRYFGIACAAGDRCARRFFKIWYMIKRLFSAVAVIGVTILAMVLAPDAAFADKRVALIVG